MVRVASSPRSHGCEAKDGWFDDVGYDEVKVKLNYHSLDVIFLAHMGILILSFSINKTPRVGGEEIILSPTP
jgi:hypothetical protein